MSVLNFNKNLVITGFTQTTNESVYFDKVNSNIAVETFYKKFKNILGDELTKIKGYVQNANIKIFITNNPLEIEPITRDKLNKLIKMLENASIIHPVTLSFKDKNNASTIAELVFHELTTSLNYTDFFNNNSKLGLPFEFGLKTSLLFDYNDIPKSWGEE